MNEALLSGMPVFMTDISPNSAVLPKEWLAKSLNQGYFMTKTKVPLYSPVPQNLAQAIDQYINLDNKLDQKQKAVEIGQQFIPQNLKQQYIDLFNSVL
jgi:hypothetical protein